MWLAFMPSARQFAHLAAVRQMSRKDRTALRRCRWRTTGVGVPLPFGTMVEDQFSARDRSDTAAARELLHALSHAVPMVEALIPSKADRHSTSDQGFGHGRGHGASTAAPSARARAVSPAGPARLSQEQLDAATYVPFLFKGHAGSADSSLGLSDAFLAPVLALTSQAPKAIAADVARLLRERCVCFERFEGTGQAYNILSPRNHSVNRWRIVRRRMLQAARMQLPEVERSFRMRPSFGQQRVPTSLPMLSSTRHATRKPLALLLRPNPGAPRGVRLGNEAEVIDELARSDWISEAVDFGSLPFAKRVDLLDRATGIIAIGGAWLAYLAFLPSEERPTALVEVYASLNANSPSAMATAKYSIARSPYDPLVRLSSALMGKGRYARVAARIWAGTPSATMELAMEPNCTEPGPRATACSGLSVEVDANAVALALAKAAGGMA